MNNYNEEELFPINYFSKKEYNKLIFINYPLIINNSNNNYYQINKLIKFFLLIIILFFLYFSFIYFILLNNYNKYHFENIKEFQNIENYFYLCNNNKLINQIKFKKMGKPKISIISSIYNREKYILRFLRSIQNQFFDDIEIILVDDFSKDNSVKLIEEYQKEDERIILIKHNKNKGTLISRNNGVLFSKGEYLIIPDIDDILSYNILYTCYQLSKNNDYEMIRFNIYYGNKTLFFNEIVNELESESINQPKLSTYLFYGLGYLKQIDFNLSNKFIKRDAYIRTLNSINPFYLNQYMINLEDGIMNFILYRTVKSFYFLNKIGYYYLQNNQSITIKPTVNYDNKIRFIFIHWKFVFDYTKNNQYEKDMVNSIFNRLYFLLIDNFNLITKDFKFYHEIINRFLNSKLINKNNKKLLNNLKKILNKKINPFNFSINNL